MSGLSCCEELLVLKFLDPGLKLQDSLIDDGFPVFLLHFISDVIIDQGLKKVFNAWCDIIPVS